MKRTALVGIMSLLFGVIAFGRASAQIVEVSLLNSQGEQVGRATLTEQTTGVKIALEAWHLRPGPHGFHIHAIGKCDPPDFLSAGGHFNPEGKKHGSKNPAGPHAGDLPNLVARPDGTASIETVATRVTFGPGNNSLLGREGSALVLHAGPDDEMSDPAGNAGARIACGVISAK